MPRTIWPETEVPDGRGKAYCHLRLYRPGPARLGTRDVPNSAGNTFITLRRNFYSMQIIFSGQGIQTAIWQYGYPTPRKWRGNPGGTSPLGTRLLERSGKSRVCYTFCPGWRGKGAAQFGADTFPHQEIRRRDGAQQSSHRLILGGAKGIYSPCPSSFVPPQRNQRGSLLHRSSSAARSVFSARFSVRWNAPPSPGWDVRPHPRSRNGRADTSVSWR